jgi:hypothetical protein
MQANAPDLDGFLPLFRLLAKPAVAVYWEL